MYILRGLVLNLAQYQIRVVLEMSHNAKAIVWMSMKLIDVI
jgi:hypothetical protein